LVRIPAAILVQIVQGTPILVFLMILYYLVFTSVNISATAVATIAFAIYFAVTAGEAMSSGLDTVEVGQFEASTAIGFSKFQRFWQISFPQAARYFIPQLTSGSIALVQSTSVVGFIAVQDLTKVGDIIRGATMDAYFPLITTALIYFLISNLLTLLLRRVEIYFDPKRRKRVVKGVMMK
ncbi:MAG: ABC transporter permease subunit, partial [Oscillospiraceae bacterium]